MNSYSRVFCLPVVFILSAGQCVHARLLWNYKRESVAIAISFTPMQ